MIKNKRLLKNKNNYHKNNHNKNNNKCNCYTNNSMKPNNNPLNNFIIMILPLAVIYIIIEFNSLKIIIILKIMM